MKQGCLIVLLGCMLLVGCSPQSTSKLEQYGIEAGIPEQMSSAWLVYWDVDDGSREASMLSEQWSEMIYFGTYFDENNELVLPSALTQTKTLLDESLTSVKPILSIVNDQVLADGSSILKSSDVLQIIFQSQSTQQEHANDLVNLALAQGYQGIELDYEAIRNDLSLWNDYLDFITILYDLCQVNDLSLRVLLEPGAPIADLEFPQGPQYVMMCYNLYGYNLTPGPKANADFLATMVEKMQLVSNNRGFALASDGYDFSQSEVKSITSLEAMTLLEAKGETIYRDEASQSVVFTYFDDTGSEH
ncbi:MAG: hypothetical protein ACRCZJ_01975, partial [Erysipelotrichaceae bacterium]